MIVAASTQHGRVRCPPLDHLVKVPHVDTHVLVLPVVQVVHGVTTELAIVNRSSIRALTIVFPPAGGTSAADGLEGRPGSGDLKVVLPGLMPVCGCGVGLLQELVYARVELVPDRPREVVAQVKARNHRVGVPPGY